MRQFFALQDLNVNDNYHFDEEQLHHLKDVLRMKENDLMRIVCSNGKAFIGQLHFERESVFATILEESFVTDKREITMVSSMIKREKWEWLIQKSCELGVSKIVPLESKRCIVHIEEKQLDKKLNRWNKIALEACQQSNRNTICEVVEPIKLKDINKYKADINFVAYENENTKLLRDALKDGSVCFVIGPEGGFEESEVEFLTKQGFETVSLGERILRAETAGLFVLSVIEAYQ